MPHIRLMPNRAACPVCRQPSDPEHAPFCSRGCKDRDLLQWLGEGYRLPGRAAAPDELANASDE